MASREQISELYGIYKQHPTVATDSRNITEGSLFFALRGPSFDGNSFAADALGQGAAMAVVDDPAVIAGQCGEEGANARFFLVDDVLETLRQLAAMHRETLGIPILAITGTNGKTTTKELVNAVMSEKFRVHATRGNLNNHIGVPLTLLAMTPGTEFGIVEMGASSKGEIMDLCRMAKPDYGIITNVGKAHLEGFGDEEGVKWAKGELYDWLSANSGYAFVRRDDRTLAEMASNRPGLHILWYESSVADGMKSQLAGNYNKFNIAAAKAIGGYFGIPDRSIYNAIRDYVPTINRSQIIETPSNIVISDCYNANPSSMRAALEWFGKLSPYDFGDTSMDKIAILGDMMELGDWSRDEHMEILNLALGMDFKRVILVGQEFSGAVPATDLSEKTAKTTLITFPDTDSAFSYLRDRHAFIKNKIILLKGSRGIALEKLLKYL